MLYREIIAICFRRIEKTNKYKSNSIQRVKLNPREISVQLNKICCERPIFPLQSSMQYVQSKYIITHTSELAFYGNYLSKCMFYSNVCVAHFPPFLPPSTHTISTHCNISRIINITLQAHSLDICHTFCTIFIPILRRQFTLNAY